MNSSNINKKPCSIFNEVLGPVMVGPSSSHTAGPARIGYMAKMLLGEDIVKAEIVFDSTGSYPQTYQGQGSDRGFIGGLLGFKAGDIRISNSLKFADKLNLEYNLRFENTGADHPNTCVLNIESASGKKLTVKTISTGGGMFEIIKVNNFEVSLKGDFHELIIEFNKIDNKDKILKLLLNNYKYKYEITEKTQKSSIAVHLKTETAIPEINIENIRKTEQNIIIYKAEPILPVPSKFNYEMPFLTAEDAIHYAKENHLELWELGIHYEVKRSGFTEDRLFEMMEEIADYMKDSAVEGIKGNIEMKGFLNPSAGSIDQAIKRKQTLFSGYLDIAVLWSIAVMEYNNSLKTIVAAPTAGSCGVIPGAVVGVGYAMGKTKRDIAKALFASSVIGIFIDHQATFAAEEGACQAENGSAGSMAAAGIVQLLGGTVEEGFKAASLALQNMLGLICDPVAGLVAIPCIGRNASTAANSIVSANMVIGGFDPVIPLDEVIQTMRETGNMLPNELKCTGRGGLCTTPTGKKLNMEWGG